MQILGVVELQILHPGRAAAGEHGEGTAVFQPGQELLGLADGGHIGGEVGVVHLLHAHELQGLHQLIHDVGAGGQAELLAQGHPDRRGDLHHHPVLGVVEGLPGLADLVFHGDGAGGAHGGALAAAHALGLVQLLVKGGHHLQLAAAVGIVQDALALELLAHPDAVAAEDALVGVPENGQTGVILLIALPGVREPDPADAEALGQGLQAAVAAFGAGGAAAVVGGQHQLQDHPPVPQQPGGVGADLQPVPRLHGAGGVDLAGFHVFHDAHAARAVDRKLGIVAEGGHVDARLADHGEDVLLPVERHPLAVYDHDSLGHGHTSSSMASIAPKGQAPQQAPQWIHLVVSMTWGMRIWPEMASMGQFRAHLPQPLHSSGMISRWRLRPLQMGQWWSTTWARYSSRK